MAKKKFTGGPKSAGSSHTPAQRSALRELRELAHAHPDKVLEVEAIIPQSSRVVAARVRLSTVGITRVPTGLPISETDEDVYIVIGDNYPNAPPQIGVNHDRFVEFPHVLKGRMLCIYLDPTREWHPSFSMAHVIERLRAWLEDAAGDHFDTRRALFHVFGGVPPATRVTPTVVVRSSPVLDSKRLSLATLRRRGPHRLDLIGWRRGRALPPEMNLLVMRLDRILPYGVETSFPLLMDQIAAADGPDPKYVVDALERAAFTSPGGTPLYLGIAIPHPAERTVVHLAVGQISAEDADLIRKQAAPRGFESMMIGWLPMCDERPEIATRRDSSRPVVAFRGKTVELWGCGGLGSWIAELVVRAGAGRIVLRDNAGVGAGLLVRQNYTEDDIGKPKVLQLAERLRAISDQVDIVPHVGTALDALQSGMLPSCDVLIDATINETVAARLDEAAQRSSGALLVQVATDPRTATLGLLVVASPQVKRGPASIDQEVAARVLEDTRLERFHGFWTNVNKNDQLVPEVGCSMPTFHGSAADMAVIAGLLVSLIGQHLMVARASGVHLLCTPAAGADGHYFLEYDYGR